MNNAIRIPITAEDLNGNGNGDGRKSHYVRCYFKARGLGIGDTWIAHEYMAWMSAMHTAFRQPRGIPDFRGYTSREQPEFNEWLLVQAEREAAQAGEESR